MDPPAIIRAYLKFSTPLSLPHDITRLVMSYLFVLESGVERAGRPDPQLSNRLHQPTLPVAQWIIKQEDDMVRLALGGDSLHEWSSMSTIFECPPVWEISADYNEEDAADTTSRPKNDTVQSPGILNSFAVVFSISCPRYR
ncbi:hypothetical protein FB446DRAFT_795569 [Lentinula raphanica]|nr:hypothetical protein FB446DRAFT_795569 [Lentinula raphanica]